MPLLASDSQALRLTKFLKLLMTKPYVNGISSDSVDSNELGDLTSCKSTDADPSAPFAELTLILLVEGQESASKQLSSQLSSMGLIDWRTLLLQWIELFSGIEQELSRVEELPTVQVLGAIQTPWSTDRELAQRLSKLDFLTWRFQSARDPDFKWDFREKSLLEFNVFYGPWVAYQLGEEFPACSVTEEWLLDQLRILCESTLATGNPGSSGQSNPDL
jgi:hypothetical protein